VYNHTPAADRKLRLFACACVRRVGANLPGGAYPRLLDLAEAEAEGGERDARFFECLGRAREQLPRTPAGAPLEAELDNVFGTAAHYAILAVADWHAEPLGGMTRGPIREHAYFFKDPSLHRAVESAAGAVSVNHPAGRKEAERREQGHQIRLLHDVFGPLPFREVVDEPGWLTADVTALARGIYDGKAFDRLPILADALQDAGCDSADILDHCRRTDWAHVRGCWVVDLLLGKPWRDPPPA
jgi:hypothetical protein